MKTQAGAGGRVMDFVMEKRKHPRFPTKLALKYRLLRHHPPKLQHAQSIDLSMGGLSFRSEGFIPHHSPALIEFIPPNQNRPIRFISQVVHAREHSAGSHFIVGIEFEHILK